MGALEDIIYWVGFVVGWLPWLALFFCTWKRSLIPLKWLDGVMGEKENTPGLIGGLKFLVLPGALSFSMNAILWFTLLPGKIDWHDFPKFCIVPRTARGLAGVHTSVWNHFGFMHFANNNFGIWTLGPLVLSYGRRTFVSSTFFTGFLGGFLVWCFAPSDTCHAGFSGVLFGWFGFLTIALFLECPPKLWRVVILLIVGVFLASTFYGDVTSGSADGVSWHGHTFGLATGIVYSYLRFRRRWFLFEGLEDRVRPLGDGSLTPLICLGRLLQEGGHGLCAAGRDIVEICLCRGPQSAGVGIGDSPGGAATVVGKASTPEAPRSSFIDSRA